MSLPTLTWSQTAYASTGYLAPTDAQVINALIANAGALLTRWRVISSVASTYIEFGGPIGSAEENARILVGVNPTAGYCSPDASGNAIWAGYAPEGGTGTLGTWNSATPYGAGVRFTGYWKAAGTASRESFYFIESEETLAIVFRDDSADGYSFYKAGAIFDPLTFPTEADGRIRGVFTSGNTNISTTFHAYPDPFTGYGNSNGNPHIGIFRPTVPTIFDAVKPHSRFDIDTNATLVGLDFDEALLSRTYYSNQTPRYFVGILRQIYISRDRSNRTVTNEGFVFSPSSSGADTILFGNS